MALAPQPLSRFPEAIGTGIGAPAVVHSNMGRFQPPLPAAPPDSGQTDIVIDASAPDSGHLGIAGGLTVSVDNSGNVSLSPIQSGPDKQAQRDETFDQNLAEVIGNAQLGTLASELMEGIESDLASRQQWVGNYIKGMDLLGLKIEKPSDLRNRKRTSTVVHPLMTEAIVTFQSMARAQLLPTAGPAKVRNDGDQDDASQTLAEDFETDLNHYLTVTAPEYVPDTDRMLWYLGYGGTTYKKVYSCPVRKRPVSEFVALPDLIVSQDATDLENAPRVTHQITMSRAQVRRLQLNGFYRDIDLAPPSPMPADTDQIKQKERSLAGQTPVNLGRPQDQPRTIWECYCEIVPSDFGFSEPEAPEGLPIPYRVSIDQSSRAILEVRRNWKQGDTGNNGYRRKRMFVKFSMVPSFGFLDLGYLHLLGNQTRALTAIWRIGIDSGLFGNFPGGFKVKGSRQSTNEYNPNPGEWVEIDIGPMTRIQDAFSPFPYKGFDAAFMQFADSIAATAKGLSGAVELEVGEGRTNAPVGTVMAMIEQQTQVMAAVHKRLHTSQQEELQLIRELFAEDPEALAKLNPNPARQWRAAQEFMDLNLVPATDPNTPSQVHRLLQANALAMLAGTPLGSKMDAGEVLRIVLRAMQITVTPALLPLDDPNAQSGQGAAQAAMVALEGQKVKTQQAAIATKAQTEAQRNSLKAQELVTDAQAGAEDRATKLKIAEMQTQADLATHQDDHAVDVAHEGREQVKDLSQMYENAASLAGAGMKLGRASDASVAAQQPKGAS